MWFHSADRYDPQIHDGAVQAGASAMILTFIKRCSTVTPLILVHVQPVGKALAAEGCQNLLVGD